MLVLLTAFILTSPPIPVGATAPAIVKPPSCPPYVIIGVYRPTEAAKELGCIYQSGIRGVVTVPFFKTQTEVPLESGQTSRFAPGHGYYAYPPSG